MNIKESAKKLSVLATGTLFLGSISAMGSVDDNTSGLFSYKSLGTGGELRNEIISHNISSNYLAEAACGGKTGEAKCGEGKSTEKKASKKSSKKESKASEHKCGEGKCGETKKAGSKEMKKASSKSTKENTSKKAAKTETKKESKTSEHKCGEGKCGAF